MANQSHLDILKQGVEAWNSWRKRNSSLIEPDLTEADLSKADLSKANITRTNLTEANLTEANLSGAGSWTILHGPEANLSRADLSRADLSRADLSLSNLVGANLTGANLHGVQLFESNLWGAKIIEANLTRANLLSADLGSAILQGSKLYGSDLIGANLAGANLSDADLTEARLNRVDLTEADLTGADLSKAGLIHSLLIRTNLTEATLTGCSIYGISAWDLVLEGTRQQNLNISDTHDPVIMVDNLEVAQFVYLLLRNEKIRDVIDTIGQKGVLILGRFTEERKRVLDAIRERLRELGFVPMMFDFERPSQQDFDETIKTLAGLSRFIIADITNPKSSPLELQAIMPNYMVPFVPIIQEDEEPFAMFQGLQHKSREWVLDVLEYDSAANLMEVLDEAVVRPALDKSDQLILKKAEAIRTRHIRDYQ